MSFFSPSLRPFAPPLRFLSLFRSVLEALDAIGVTCVYVSSQVKDRKKRDHLRESPSFFFYRLWTRRSSEPSSLRQSPASRRKPSSRFSSWSSNLERGASICLRRPESSFGLPPRRAFALSLLFRRLTAPHPLVAFSLLVHRTLLVPRHRAAGAQGLFFALLIPSAPFPHPPSLLSPSLTPVPFILHAQRAHRQGQLKPVVAYTLIASGTNEEQQYNLLRSTKSAAKGAKISGAAQTQTLMKDPRMRDLLQVGRGLFPLASFRNRRKSDLRCFVSTRPAPPLRGRAFGGNGGWGEGGVGD